MVCATQSGLRGQYDTHFLVEKSPNSRLQIGKGRGIRRVGMTKHNPEYLFGRLFISLAANENPWLRAERRDASAMKARPTMWRTIMYEVARYL